MDYGKMLFYPAQASKMPQTTSATLTTSFKVGQAITNLFLQPTEPSSSYFNYDNNFDLSLLPQQDCAVATTSTTESNNNININNINNNNNNNIPTTVYQYAVQQPATPSTPNTPPQIKIEQTWTCGSAEDVKQEPFYALNYEHLSHPQQQQQQQQQHQTKSPNLLIPPPAYPQIYPSPQSSPAQSEYGGFPQTQFAGCYDSLSSSRTSLYSSSPCPSLSDISNSIKQEPLHILPPSPPESSCEAPSPHSLCAVDIKVEPFDNDVESTLIDLNTLLKVQPYQDYANTKQQQQQQQQPQQDHQLLREYLEDTTFQRKHNLKPLALESFIGGLEEVRGGDIEPVISLALDYAKREADATCAKLQISQDPSAWTPIQVHAWLRSTIAQFKLPPIDDLETKFCEDGAAFILLSDEEFTRRSPESGSTLHAQLEIWKLAYSDGNWSDIKDISIPVQQPTNESAMAAANVQMQQGMWNTGGDCLQTVNMDVENQSEDEEEVPATVSSSSTTPTATNAANTTASTGPTAAIAGTGVVPKRAGATPGRNGSSHIHLWQFLKELLAAPHLNGTAIRWIDRAKGIFKIEDSVRVAKLWGRRKNRPAMNYDKLSRSIRQYYKKGIMKKTERSQRLVYQFCHPYHM